MLSLKFEWKVGSTEDIIRENLGLEPEKLQSTQIRATSLLKLKSIIPQKRRLIRAKRPKMTEVFLQTNLYTNNRYIVVRSVQNDRFLINLQKVKIETIVGLILIF